MGVSISLSITQNSQSITDNTSNVTVKVTAKWTSGSWNGYDKPGWLKIDGTKYTFSSPFNTGQSTSGSKTLFTKTVNVPHNSDGTKKLSCSASYTSGVSSGTVTCSGSKTLTTIPRKSTLTVANGTLGTAQTLTITQNSTSFTHVLKAVCGNSTYYIKADGTLSTSSVTHNDCSIPYTPPIAWASQNTTGTSVSVTYTLTTYNGSTSLGSNSYTKTYSIPSSVAPTCTVVVSDPTGYVTTYGKYIRGRSKFKVDITPTTSYGSPIKTYGGSANGQTITAASTTTGVINSSGTLTITGKVTDARGRIGSKSITANVANYSQASITSLSVHRCKSATDGTEDMQGEYIQVKFSSSVSSLSDCTKSNTAAYVLKYKKKSDATYTSVTLTSYANNYAVSNGTYIFAADTGSSYDVELMVTDAFGSNNASTSASTGFALMHWNDAGDGLAVGKVAERSGFEVGMKSTFHENMRFAYSEYGEGMIGGTLSDGTEVYNFQPLSENGNCVIGWGNHERGVGVTNIYSGEGVNMYVAGEEKGIFIGRNTNGHTLINYAAADNNTSSTYIYGNNVEIRATNAAYTNCSIVIPNNKLIYGKNSNGDVRQMMHINGSNELYVGYGGYQNKEGITKLCGNDVGIYSSAAGNVGTRPYYRAGDSVTIYNFVGGYVTNSGTHICFTIPLSKPVIGSPTVTVTSTDGLIIRQNGKYTHGTAAGTFVKPSVYDEVLDDNAVRITATINTTTNVVNNAACGIQASVVITFS